MAFGVTKQGFVLKRLEDILQESRQAAASIFGDLVPPGDVVDTTDSSVLGRLINLDAEGDAELWEALNQAYSAMDPNTATGIALDNLVAYAGLFRLEEAKSTVPLILTGDYNLSIAMGSLVQSPTTSTKFELTKPVVLDLEDAIGVDVVVNTVSNDTLYQITYYSDAAGTDIVEYTSDSDATDQEILAGLKSDIDLNHPRLTATVEGASLKIVVSDNFQFTDFTLSAELSPVKVQKLVDGRALEAGPKPAPPNTITQIVTSLSGWDSVTNPVAASKGRFEETDEELRLRFENTKSTRGVNTIESILSDVSEVDGVTTVRVYENDSANTDANGLPPHSFLTVVVGGVQQDIVDAIYVNKPAGIQAFGNITVPVLDSQAIPHDISFSRPSLIDIHIDIVLTTFGDFPDGGEDLIREAIVEYAANNFGVAEDVVFSRLYTPVNSVGGHQVDSLQIGTSSGSTSASNVAIGFDELSNFIKGNINITVS